MITAHLEELSIDAKGFNTKARAGVLKIEDKQTPQPQQDPAKPVQLANSKEESTESTLDYDGMKCSTKKILKTLWYFQRKYNGAKYTSTRWCFSVGLNAPDYMYFSMGQLELIGRHLVDVNPNGLTFLTDNGIHFCIKYDSSILDYPSMYDTFQDGPSPL